MILNDLLVFVPVMQEKDGMFPKDIASVVTFVLGNNYALTILIVAKLQSKDLGFLPSEPRK